MDFRILGPLEVLDEARRVALGGDKQRALLGLLLVHANETLSTDRLIDELWGEHPPTTAAKTVQVHISRLRKALAAGGGNGSEGLVVTREHGYQLEIDPERVDSRRFERLLSEARSELAANRPETAAPALERALALWRGEPLADLAYEGFAQAEIARLEDLRVAAVEHLIDAKLALGRHAEVIGELESLVGEYPYREHLRAQLMLALYRSDRQADALQAFQDARRALVEELGIEPGERLRELERAVLAQDPELGYSAPRAVEPPAEPPAEAPPDGRAAEPAPLETGATPSARRLVSIVFADLVGSTALAEQLDPESMHGVLDRFTEMCSEVIERHGGSVEGFIGDAVVGVFGLTELHEDDALRAVRVAIEMRDAGAALSADLKRERGVEIAMKFGVESGEVFLGAGTRRTQFAAGDAYNVASRLEGIAREGEILLGENIHELVRDAVRVERLEPVALKGRTAKVQARRLLELADDQTWVRPSGTPFVDRESELEELREVFGRVRRARGCHAITVVGPAGIGKSRLARELIPDVGEDGTVVVGRCPAYGEGVTYRPLAEIVSQLGGTDPRQRVTELLEGEESMARLVLGAIGLSEGAAQPEETFWAVRKLLERVAQSGPLLVIVDDIHWAEPTLIDLLEYLVAFSSEHPILLLCLARPDFVQARPAWVAPQPNRSLLMLGALPETEARQLVESAGSGELWSRTATRIVETAEGNPLFLEQLIAMGAEGDEAALPSTIQAVLAARIDGLAPAERALLEHASVQGRSFYAGPLAEVLECEPSELAPHMVSLVQKQLIRAERSDLPGEDAFRFAHVLIREAAYHGVPKQRRAELHEHLAQWLQDRGGAEDETLGHHLGEAYRCRAELGLAGEREQALAKAAAERLAAAADAALLRGDPHAGARLLERATSLLEGDAAACGELLPALGAALFEAGRMGDAARILDEAIARAPAERLRARAQVERELVRLETETNVGTEQARSVIDAVLPLLESEGDEYGLSRVLLLRGWLAYELGYVASADESWRESAENLRSARCERELFEIIGWRALAAVLGPDPVDDAISRCEEFRELVRSSPIATASTLNPLAVLHAMKGEFETAEQLLQQAGEMLHELGGIGSGVSHLETWVRLLADRPALAEARLRADMDTLSSMNAGGALATTTALLAQVVYAQGRMREAGELCRMTQRRAAAEDTMTQVIWRGVQAKVLAHEGRGEEAESLAREAVTLAEPTDLLLHRGDAMLDLAEVLRTCERIEESDHAAFTALKLYELKGNVAAAARAVAAQSSNRR
ncbi:MAG TPA: BTAD domain-containing putative transcriptional regulator [Thermoleophilaceae bacterium]|nr:BTAD domain-containing putative transcriptional regulator [Thermoleophilaceae bacterium]